MTSKKQRAKKKTPVKKKTTVKKSTPKKAKSKSVTPVKIKGKSRFSSKIRMCDIEKVRDLIALKRHNSDDQKLKYSDTFVPLIRDNMAQGRDLNDFAKLVGVHTNTITVWAQTYRGFLDALIEGQLEFIDSLGPRLVEHMIAGNSFESFSGVIGKSRQWLYDLVREDPMFAKAKEIGTGKSMYMWEQLLKAQASGTLQRVKETVPVMDDDGNPQIDGNGNAIERRIYTPAMGSDRSLQFAMRARFKFYRPEEGQSDQTVKDELAGALAALDEEEKGS